MAGSAQEGESGKAMSGTRVAQAVRVTSPASLPLVIGAALSVIGAAWCLVSAASASAAARRSQLEMGV